MTFDGPDAPWNEEEKPSKTVYVTVSITMSKFMEIKVDDYIADCDDEEAHNTEYVLANAVNNTVVLPHELSRYMKSFFKYDPSFKNVEVPKHLKEIMEGCDNWIIDDMEVIRE